MRRMSARVVVHGRSTTRGAVRRPTRSLTRIRSAEKEAGTTSFPTPPHHRVFIGRQDRVMVVDETNGKLLGEVTGIHGAHGTAIAERAGHGFATSGNDSSVVMFDLDDVQAARPDPRGRRRRRDHLRSRRRTACSPSTATRIPPP